MKIKIEYDSKFVGKKVLTSCSDPAAGMESKAAKPDFTDANGTPKAMSPGSLLPAVVIMWPRIASMEIRPCLTSTYILNSSIDLINNSYNLSSIPAADNKFLEHTTLTV